MLAKKGPNSLCTADTLGPIANVGSSEKIVPPRRWDTIVDWTITRFVPGFLLEGHTG